MKKTVARIFSAPERNWDKQFRKTQKMVASTIEEPVMVQNTDEGVTASTTEATLTISANSALDQRVDREQLANGVEIRLNGKLIGLLRQTQRSFNRTGRAMLVEGVEPNQFPLGTQFRLRGAYTMALECDSGRLIKQGGFFRRRMRVVPHIKLALILLFAAVCHGFREPVRNATAWLPTDST